LLISTCRPREEGDVLAAAGAAGLFMNQRMARKPTSATAMICGMLIEVCASAMACTGAQKSPEEGGGYAPLALRLKKVVQLRFWMWFLIVVLSSPINTRPSLFYLKIWFWIEVHKKACRVDLSSNVVEVVRTESQCNCRKSDAKFGNHERHVKLQAKGLETPIEDFSL
jgi:hypothetical protein